MCKPLPGRWEKGLGEKSTLTLNFDAYNSIKYLSNKNLSQASKTSL